MPIDYSEFRDVAERAKKRGLIAQLQSPTIKKAGTPKQQKRKRKVGKRDDSGDLPGSKYHWVIFKIACTACGAAKGERCEPTIGLTEQVPVHASRIHDAKRSR